MHKLKKYKTKVEVTTGPNPGFCFPYPSSFSILHFSNAILTYCFTANFGLETNMALRNDLLFFSIQKNIPRILGIGVGFRSCVFTWIAFCKSTGSKFSCIFLTTPCLSASDTAEGRVPLSGYAQAGHCPRNRQSLDLQPVSNLRICRNNSSVRSDSRVSA